MPTLESRYNSEEAERKIYELWEQSGYFNPDKCIEDGITKKDAPPFSMVLPPPNVTGTLHIGHAFEDTLQDIIVRYYRMKGRRTLWIPGTDHAAIATQAKVEKILEKEGKKKRDLGREEFLHRVEAFAQESHDTIVQQVRRMGASLDWSREAFTLDEKRALAVRTAFAKLHDLGLIYRGNRVVNWDPKGQTVISDDEVVYEERTAKFYTFRYAPEFPIPISTTRPETKVGDTAVAVHPTDPRYKKFIGQEFEVNFVGVPIKIKIVGDASVDKDFGTGALGVTPAHSMIDWEIAERHHLPRPQVIDEYGRMMVAGPLQSMKTLEAREWVVEELRKQNLIEKEEEITQNISTAERTGAVIEPLPKLQWFIDVNKKFSLPHSKIEGLPTGSMVSLKDLMRHVVATKQIAIVPERFEKTYFHWTDNLRDWCISRQLWYGHRVPVWYKEKEIYCGVASPSGGDWEQDPDTLDTWFSSGLWTFSTLGWPEKTPDLDAYHPNSFMAPGYEILFFWVARMILMSGSLLGEIPFRTVYLHGIVRDAKGKKFSKSSGNSPNPVVFADTYGADALRMALVVGASPGSDVKFDEQKVKGYRNFITKLWNIARFIEMNRPENFLENSAKSAREEEITQEAMVLKKEVTAHIEQFEFHLAAEKLYHYIWHTFADKIIEEMKPILKDGTDEEKSIAYRTLHETLLELLIALHPFMPYVTEALYQELFVGPGRPRLLMIHPFDTAL